MDFGLRRIILAIGFLSALGGGGAVHAANCTGSGSFSITISPCPVTKIIRLGTATPVSFSVHTKGTLPKLFYVVAAGDNSVINSRTFSAGFINATEFTFGFATPTTLSDGKHIGTLTMKLCSTPTCKIVFVSAALPYEFDVDAPPAITVMSPKSKTVGAAAFTLTLTGRFTSDCKIHFGSTVLATKFVSSTKLTGTVSIASVAHGQTYAVTVVPASGLVSNAPTFTLENPVPVLSVLDPAELTVGGAPFKLKLTGKDFVATSTVMLGTTALKTTYVSHTVLKAVVDLSAATTGGTYAITVSSPTPAGGTSAVANITLDNVVPAISSLSPSRTEIVLGLKNITVNGSGFQPNSVVSWNGAPQPTGYVSATQLTVTSPTISSLGAPSDVTLAVTNPAPGGGTSNSAVLAVATPTLNWISPIRAYAGSGDMTLTVAGFDFTSNSVVQWNGTTLQTTAQAGNVLQATVPAADLANPGNFTISVVTPGLTGTANSTTLPVVIQPPAIASLSPGFAAPGSGQFTLTVYGDSFDPAATVQWNGTALATTHVSASELQATVPAADMTNAGVAAISVLNPVAAGGGSREAFFAIDVGSTRVVPMALAVNDIEWDPDHAIFYGSTPAVAAMNPHSIVKIDPLSATVTGGQDVSFATGIGGFSADLLSRTQDGQFLYMSGQGWVISVALPSLQPLGGSSRTGTVLSMEPSPNFAEVVAWTVFESSSTTLKLISGAGAASPLSTAKPWSSLAWSPDGSTLYAGDGPSGTDFSSVAYTATAAQPEVVTPGAWSGGRMHVDAASGLIYADSSPSVIDPANPSSVVATYPVSGVMVPDSSLACAYFITQTAAQVTAGANDYTLSCYSTVDQSLTRSIVIPAVNGTPTKLMRWGNEGLVFITDAGYIYFVSGQMVTGI